MACRNCEQAALRAWWPQFTATCYGCAARELAQSPAFFHSMQAGRFRDDYTAQLRATYGRTKADIEAGHRQVKAAARALAQPRLIA
jgi:hypothetical protein